MPIARTSFTVVVDGRLVDVTAGDVHPPTDRIVKVRPDLFTGLVDEPDGAAVAHDEEND